MITKFKLFEININDPWDEEVWDENAYFIGHVLVNNDEIKKGDYIIDIEKVNVSINDEKMGVVKCVDVLDQYDLVWASIDGESSACDSIYQFKKVLNYKN